jgi:hypothetical protein
VLSPDFECLTGPRAAGRQNSGGRESSRCCKDSSYPCRPPGLSRFESALQRPTRRAANNSKLHDRESTGAVHPMKAFALHKPSQQSQLVGLSLRRHNPALERRSSGQGHVSAKRALRLSPISSGPGLHRSSSSQVKARPGAKKRVPTARESTQQNKGHLTFIIKSASNHMIIIVNESKLLRLSRFTRLTRL